MATEAYTIERAKAFKYRVEINGLPGAMVQSFNPGKVSIAETSHASGGQNHLVYEAGMVSFEDATLSSVVPLEGPGLKYWNEWIKQAQNSLNGRGGKPSEYKKNFSVYLMGPSDKPIKVWEFKGAWIKEYTPGAMDSKQDAEDVIDEIVIRYDNREERYF